MCYRPVQSGTEAPVGPSVGVGLISSSSLDRPWSHHCDCAIQNPTAALQMAPVHSTQGLNRPNRPDWKIVKPRGEGGGSRGIFLSPHCLYFLVTLSSLSSAAEPRANLYPCCCSSLQLSVHCLIGSGSMAATCICYLFVPISRCEALQPTPQPGCATC